MDEIDKLLANLNPAPAPSKSTPPAKSSSNQSIEDLLAQLDPASTPKPQTPDPAPTSKPQTPKPQTPEPLLSSIKSELEQQKAAALKQAESEQRQKQQRLEQLQQQRRATLAEQAAQWLKSLDPKSSEGRWFEEFACNYDSRLEAAIDYLEALQELE